MQICYLYRRTDVHTDIRTHRQTIFELVDRQTDRNIHTTIYVPRDFMAVGRRILFGVQILQK